MDKSWVRKRRNGIIPWFSVYKTSCSESHSKACFTLSKVRLGGVEKPNDQKIKRSTSRYLFNLPKQNLNVLEQVIHSDFQLSWTLGAIECILCQNSIKINFRFIDFFFNLSQFVHSYSILKYEFSGITDHVLGTILEGADISAVEQCHPVDELESYLCLYIWHLFWWKIMTVRYWYISRTHRLQRNCK